VIAQIQTRIEVAVWAGVIAFILPAHLPLFWLQRRINRIYAPAERPVVADLKLASRREILAFSLWNLAYGTWWKTYVRVNLWTALLAAVVCGFVLLL